MTADTITVRTDPVGSGPVDLPLGCEQACQMCHMRSDLFNSIFATCAKSTHSFLVLTSWSSLGHDDVKDANIGETIPQQACCLRNSIPIGVFPKFARFDRQALHLNCSHLIHVKLAILVWYYDDINIARLQSGL